MATYTTNLNLKMPGGSDKIRIAEINANMEAIDEAVGAVGNTSLQAQVTAAKDNLIYCSTAVSIPASGSSVTKTVTGLTANHQLIRWNFSSSAENAPPVGLTWTTAAGQFTIQNNGGTTSETIKPVFALPTSRSAS